MHVAIKPKIMYFGTPVVLISTLNEEYMNDKINLQRQMGRMNNEETRRRIVFRKKRHCFSACVSKNNEGFAVYSQTLFPECNKEVVQENTLITCGHGSFFYSQHVGDAFSRKACSGNDVVLTGTCLKSPRTYRHVSCLLFILRLLVVG